jgi:hypothetical protein
MLKFVFILTLWNGPDAPAVYVAESDLTGAECVAEVANYVATTPGLEFGLPSCEPDMAEMTVIFHDGQELTLAACPTEDSDNCAWDAARQGNGRGESFYTIEGESFPLD